MKILFIHNSIPEYRLRFMVQLSMCCDVKYLITDRNLASAIYGSHPQLPKELNVSFLMVDLTLKLSGMKLTIMRMILLYYLRLMIFFSIL